ncbi:MAG: 7-cyano-7-deazaguanine synthase QueC [Bacteroidales bacterium]|nr:7-cyano-7-deazaguanine synthase QueC [Bacteroidales bacterium]
MNNDYNRHALVLFSGGQDSTTCLYWAKSRFKHVHALCFEYGQRHSQEVENARRLAERAGTTFQLVEANVIAKLSLNSLTDPSMEMDETYPDKSHPNTFVPGRNLFFLTFAAAIAYGRGIRHIVTGVSEADYSGYPDCRDTFVHSANATLNLAMDRQFEIHTPLMWRNKKEVWQLAEELGVFEIVQNETLTCYNGILAQGCGHCPACRLRNEGLKEYLADKITK